MIRHEGNLIHIDPHGYIEKVDDTVCIHLDGIPMALINFLSTYFHRVHYEQNPEQIQVNGQHISQFSNYLETLKKEEPTDGPKDEAVD